MDIAQRYDGAVQTADKKNSADSGATVGMSLLINSIYYFLECVFILCGDDGYRLVVLHHGRVLTDGRYRSLRGARTAFSRKYRDKAWAGSVKAQWSPFYVPAPQWLAEKIPEIPGPSH